MCKEWRIYHQRFFCTMLLAVHDSLWDRASAVGAQLLQAYCIFSVIVVVSVVLAAGGLTVQEFRSRQSKICYSKKK